MEKYLPSFADVLSFSGLCLLGYGLFLYEPWIAYSVCGSLMFAMGIIGAMNERNG